MANFGFVIDNGSCIGCHACTTACKSENEVPLGVNRTWVKYVETGAFPDTRRHFQVTRCNHCANPPCVTICPVTAMYQRADGIVEFDPEICIGCKACMQACPYDAIYIDPASGTAAKCHYCAHRTDIGLEPACVVVCPVHAIIAGDMDDPGSEISRRLASNRVTVRKPEQGTAPKLFYIEGNDFSMHPTVTGGAPETYMFADVIPLHEVHEVKPGAKGGRGGPGRTRETDASRRTAHAAPHTSHPLPRGSHPAPRTSHPAPRTSHPAPRTSHAGPIQFGGRMAEHMVQVAYNAQHKLPWHWPVPAYLVTKGIGTGIFMLLGLGWVFDAFAFDPSAFLAGGFTSLLFIGITTGLLVFDLERPERFLRVLLRPQWGSWLARGAYLLVGFSAVTGVWWLVELGVALGWIGEAASVLRPYLLWAGLPLAAGAAVYTAFLFGQAEGRDLWQSALLPIHLIVQAFAAGAGMLLALAVPGWIGPELADAARVVLITALLVDLLMILAGEFGIRHASDVAAQAAHAIRSGRYKNHFWWGGIVLGHLAPLALLLVSSTPTAAAAAGLAAIAGLYFYEFAYVMAPQEVPNS